MSVFYKTYKIYKSDWTGEDEPIEITSGAIYDAVINALRDFYAVHTISGKWSYTTDIKYSNEYAPGCFEPFVIKMKRENGDLQVYYRGLLAWEFPIIVKEVVFLEDKNTLSDTDPNRIINMYWEKKERKNIGPSFEYIGFI